MNKVNILSINISEKKGTIKKPIDKALLTYKGIENDAHSGFWHRQVSMLAIESIHRFEQVLNRTIAFGEFAENITTKGFELKQCKPLDRFVGSQVELLVTQIGKSCHGDGCSIFQQVGKCVMPKEGIFVKVLKEGLLQTGDWLVYQPKIFKTLIITLSDRAYSGEYEDKSGPKIKEILSNYFKEKERQNHIDLQLIPDDANRLFNLVNWAVKEKYDLIFTTGGTGISPRDITVDTIKPMLHKEIQGIMEFIRIKYGSNKPQALLSRGIAGVIDYTILFTLPGSTNACTEYMTEIVPQLEHMFYMMYGINKH